MSVGTMVAETDSSFNRRRGREPTQIYRPPPARSLRTNEVSSKSNENRSLYKEHVMQQQQQYLEALKQYQTNLQQRVVNSTKATQYPSSPGQNMGSRDGGDKQRTRRPDQRFYVPRGRRHPDDPTPCSTPTPFDEHPRAPSPANSICSVVSEYSGRNRYSRQGRYSKLYHDEDSGGYIKSSLAFSRESTPMSERGGKGKSLFAAETLQLIERCINQDTNRPLSGSSTWENSPSSNKNTRGMRNGDLRDIMKGTNPSPRDNHPVHSKENLMHPVGQNNRSRKGRRNRKHISKSRDQSLENRDHYNRRGSISSENLEQTFYNSGATPYERHHLNYDRINSRNSSRASSRNPSVERNASYDSPSSTPEWRLKGFSTPTSPVKQSPAITDRSQRRHSLGKPPTGKIGGAAYNVHLAASSYTSVNSGATDGAPLRNEYEVPPSHPEDERESKESKVSSGPSQCISPSLKAEGDVPSPTSLPLGDSSHEKDTAEESLNQHGIDDSISSQSSELSEKPISSDESLTVSSSLTTEKEETENDGTRRDIVDQQKSDQIDSVATSHVNESNPQGSPPPAPQPEIEVSASHNTESTVPDHGDEGNSSIEVKESVSFSSTDAHHSPLPSPPNPSSPASVQHEELNPKKFSFSWADEVDQVDEQDSWDMLYDESGNYLQSSIKDQLEDAIGNIKLQKPANDYHEFKPQEHHIADEEYGHIIEIYDFPSAFQTQDLMSVFQDFKGLDLKWVDDTHALGIFSSNLIAADCLNMVHPFVKTRPLSKAIEASKSKAIRLAERLPFKPRPETSVALARRLVSGALGLKVQVSKEQRDAERQKLKNAKEKKRLIAKQKEDAWEGTLGNTI